MKILDVYAGNDFSVTDAIKAGYSGVIFRAGQGDGTIMPNFDVPHVKPQWVTDCKNSNFPYGFYWVVDPRFSAGSHVNKIKSVFPANEYGQLGMWMDFEKPYDMKDAVYWTFTNAGWNLLYAVAEGVRVASGKLPGVYTSPGFWKLVCWKMPAASQVWFAQAPLWVAHYGVTKPSLFGAWKDYDFWQYQEGPDDSLVNPAVQAKYFSDVPPVVPPPALVTIAGIDVQAVDGALKSSIVTFTDLSKVDYTSKTTFTNTTSPIVPPVITPTPSADLYYTKKYGDPDLNAAGFSVGIDGHVPSNFGVVQLLVEDATGKVNTSSSVSGFLKIPEADYQRMLDMQPTNGGVTRQQQDAWFFGSGKGRPYLVNDDPLLRNWGHLSFAGQPVLAVANSEKTVRISLPNSGVFTMEPTIQLVCFTKGDWGKDPEQFPWLIQRATAAHWDGTNQVYNDAPRGVLYSPLWSPVQWSGNEHAVAFRMPLRWLVKA